MVEVKRPNEPQDSPMEDVQSTTPSTEESIPEASPLFKVDPDFLSKYFFALVELTFNSYSMADLVTLKVLLETQVICFEHTTRDSFLSESFIYGSVMVNVSVY
jgi:hypothetical protein